MVIAGDRRRRQLGDQLSPARTRESVVDLPNRRGLGTRAARPWPVHRTRPWTLGLHVAPHPRFKSDRIASPRRKSRCNSLQAAARRVAGEMTPPGGPALRRGGARPGARALVQGRQSGRSFGLCRNQMLALVLMSAARFTIAGRVVRGSARLRVLADRAAPEIHARRPSNIGRGQRRRSPALPSTVDHVKAAGHERPVAVRAGCPRAAAIRPASGRPPR